MTLTPPIPQDQLNVLQPAATLVPIAKDAPQRIEFEALALRLNAMANNGETAYTPTKPLMTATITELKSRGYIITPRHGQLVEISLPETEDT